LLLRCLTSTQRPTSVEVATSSSPDWCNCGLTRTSSPASTGRDSRPELRPIWTNIMPPASASVPLTLARPARARLPAITFHFLHCPRPSRKAIFIRRQSLRPQDPLNRVRLNTRLSQTPLRLTGKGRLWTLLISPKSRATRAPQHHCLSKWKMR
jgi:hypothetical protein